MKLTQLTELMKQYQVSSKKQETKVLKTVDPETLARISAICIIENAKENIEVAKIITKLGREIMIPYVNDNDTEEQKAIQAAKVGADMLNIFVKSKLIKVHQRLFIPQKNVYLTNEKRKGLQQRQPNIISMLDKLKCAEIYSEVMNDELNKINLSYRPQYTKPKEWNKPFHPVFGPLVRKGNKNLIKHIEKHQIPKVYNAINKMQSTQLSISSDVFEAAVFSLADDVLTLNDKNLSIEQKTSSHMATVRSLNIADEIGSRKFYTGIFADFRGRLYPTMTGLNVLGDDLQKGLIRLGKKREITEDGIYWLKIHLANCCGQDKLPLEDRIAYIEANWAILSAQVEFKTQKHWQTLDSPFCALGAIIELVKCNNNPKYKTDIMTAIDATNSGSQFYSALARDKNGMFLTNLTDVEDRQDLYLAVADKVWSKWSGDDFWHQYYGDRRKLAKRPVMTIAYNAQERTIADAIYSDHSPDYPDMKRKDAQDLANAIYDAYYDIMPGVEGVMNFFTALAKEANDNDNDLKVVIPQTEWPMLHNYRKDVVKRMQFRFGNKLTNVSVCIGRGKKLMKPKQKISAAPNIIHAVDASLVHLLLNHVNYGVLTIHDSFMTHPSDTEKLFSDVRETFYRIVKVDILKEISTVNTEVTDFVEYGDGDLKGVLYNDFCFS